MWWRGFHYWFGDSVRAHFEIEGLPADIVTRIEDKARAGEFPRPLPPGRYRIDEPPADTRFAPGYRVPDVHDSVHLVHETAWPFVILEDVRLRFNGATGVDCEVQFPRLRKRVLIAMLLATLASLGFGASLAVVLHIPLLFAAAAAAFIAFHFVLFCIAPLWTAQSHALPNVETALRALATETSQARVRVEVAEALQDDEEEAHAQPLRR